MINEKYVIGNILKIIHWDENFFSIIINASINKFIEGQFTLIKFNLNNKIIKRAYSFINSPNSKNIEFYIAYIPKGILTPKLYNLNIGDKIIICKSASGSLIIKNVPLIEDLWMLSTGTAIGPYLSILTNKSNLNRFKNIILVNAVRFVKDFNYLSKISFFKKEFFHKFKFIQIISREKNNSLLHGHIPFLIENGSLEKKANLFIDNKKSHIMLCGNPNMIKDTKKILINKFNMNINYINKPGNITIENYW